MKTSHYVVTGLLVVGLLYVYHTMIANPGTFGKFTSGLGINR
jgi:hypothetical protein